MKVRFLTAIWGARYVEEFAGVSLPSYLAPGNLPALAAATDLEVVILTSNASQDAFDQQPLFKKLRAIAPVRFIYIDDLITTGNYGVTLTLAYARGIAFMGAEQTSTYFVFMNSDFVLADGSLRHLASKLAEGHSCIMAPSLRARSEPVLPILRDAVDRKAGYLSMSPREMVRLTLDHLHPTVIGKTVTQRFVTCTTHNQLYWQVDRDTLLARNHLIFMLAIKPEVPLGPINSYCDYGFVPEMVPSGKFTVIGDSDDYYMLELQPEAQEANFMRCGTTSPEQIAKELSDWTTREHRLFAQSDAVFHAGALPADLESARQAAGKLVNEIHAAMSPPLDHADHYYWALGMQAWKQLMTASVGKGFKMPPECKTYPERADTSQGGGAGSPLGIRSRHLLRHYYLASMAFARRNVYGIRPLVHLWHDEWQDCKLLLQTLSEAKNSKNGPVLLVWDTQTWLPGFLRHSEAFDICLGTDDLLFRSKSVRPETRLLRPHVDSQGYASAILYLRRSNIKDARRVFEPLMEHVQPEATVYVYVDFPNAADDSSNFTVELAQNVQYLLPASWMRYDITGRFVGGRGKRRLASYKQGLTRALWPLSPARLPRAALALLCFPVVAGATMLYNMVGRGASADCPDWISSALLVLKMSRSEVAIDPAEPAGDACDPIAKPDMAAPMAARGHSHSA